MIVDKGGSRLTVALPFGRQALGGHSLQSTGNLIRLGGMP